PTGTVVGGGLPSANVGLRKRLDLYSSLRPVKSVPSVKTRYENVDLVVVRENTESLYSGLEHIIIPGVVESLKIITEKASTRIARFGFEHAKKMGRKRVTAVHKANIMKLSDGLFLDCCRKVGREFPEITYDEFIVDNLCMQLVRDPTRFDVLVLENLYGDIVSDLCAGLVGGLGVVPGANIGERTAVFEAVHGTAPDIAGKGIANPTALMMSAVMMLDWMDMRDEAKRMASAIQKVYTDGKTRTGDIGGSATTREFTDAIIAAL
ncbi:MAG TPA: isocitrate/isopropylmalate family dehydrogenase, partial [Myxococcaceae bacterium]|nr:isocitrate/isopropylmalate family dehydrogenase [Myxococcaceae bacterium]